MQKACPKCGKIHSFGLNCTPKTYRGGDERKLRNRYSWARKSKEIREKANFLCEACLDEGVLTYDNLSVHHIKKLSLYGEKVLLDNYNLVCLCEKHHKDADDGKIDPKYLEQLAKDREDGRKKIPPSLFDGMI